MSGVSEHHENCCMILWLHTVKPLSNSTAIPQRWHGDLKFLRGPWDRTKILKNIANKFTFSITWRCHGAPTATVAFSRSAHGMPPRSNRVLTDDWLRSHEALTACKELSLRIDAVHTVRTARPMRFYGVFTECIRAYEKTSATGIGNFIYLFHIITFNAGEDRHINSNDVGYLRNNTVGM